MIAHDGAAPDGAADVRGAAVLGGGTMGLGIAQVLGLAGMRVWLCDADAERTEEAKQRLRERTRLQVETGLRDTADLTRIEGVHACHPAERAVAEAELVVEAVPEDAALKGELLSTVSRAVSEHAVIATNTSSYPVDVLAEHVHGPERFLGLHWFSPPEWVPGVEVVTGSATADEVVERSRALLLQVGKRPSVVQSSPGFVANRLQMALFAEAVSCVEEGVASPGEIDEVVRSSFGFRLPYFGPFQIADLAGLDVYLSVFETLEERLGSRFAPPAALVDQVRSGRYGTKSGAGFRDYTDQQRQRLLAERDHRYAALAGFLADNPPPGAQPHAGEDERR